MRTHKDDLKRARSYQRQAATGGWILFDSPHQSRSCESRQPLSNHNRLSRLKMIVDRHLDLRNIAWKIHYTMARRSRNVARDLGFPNEKATYDAPMLCRAARHTDNGDLAAS
jgi:hypothetical protein